MFRRLNRPAPSQSLPSQPPSTGLRHPRWCSNGSKFVTVNSNYICLTTHVAYASTNKIKIVCIETELGFFLPRADAPRVYVRACMLCCFHGLIRGPIHTLCIAFLHLSPRKEGCRKPVLGVWDLYYTWRSMVFLVPKPFGARWHHRSRARQSRHLRSFLANAGTTTTQ